MQIMTEWTPIAVLLGDGEPERTAPPVSEETDTMLDGLFLAFAKARVALTEPQPSSDLSSPAP